MYQDEKSDVTCVYADNKEYFAIEYHDTPLPYLEPKFDLFKIVEDGTKLNCLRDVWLREDEEGNLIKGVIISKDGNSAPRDLFRHLKHKYQWKIVDTEE